MLKLEISIYDCIHIHIMYDTCIVCTIQPKTTALLYWGRQNTMMLPFAYICMYFLHAPKNLLKGGGE